MNADMADNTDVLDENICEPPYELSSDTDEKVRMAMRENVEPLTTFFKILADSIRIRILKALKICDLCVCVLVEITDYKYPALSYHLKLLKDRGLVDSRRDGSFQIYFLTELGVKTVALLGDLDE